MSRVRGRSTRLMGGAAVLAAGSIVAKLIGAFYRVPLTNVLGAEGMGVYQLVFPVFALFMTLSTAGIPTALSRIVAEQRARGESAKKYLVSALIALVTLSVCAGIIILALSHSLATWQGNPSAAKGYVAIAPAVVFVAVIAGFRGWFQGEMYMIPTAVSNVVEQAVKLGAGIGFALWLAPKGLEWAVVGALMGITASECVAALYLALTYFIRSRRAGEGKQSLRLDATERKAMFRTALPIALLGLLMPLGSFFDSMIVVNALKWGGADTAYATAQYGLYSGPVTSLVNMPVVVIMALAIAVVPSVSVSRAAHDLEAILVKSRMSIKLVYLLGVPSALFLMVFGRNVLALLYPTLSAGELNIAVNLLAISAFGVVLTGGTQIYISLMQALDRTKTAIKVLIVAIMLKVVLALVLVRFAGIMGAAVAGVSMSVVSLVLLTIKFHSLTDLRLEKNVAQTMVSGVIMALIAVVVRTYVPTNIGAIAVGAAVCVLVYGWLTTLFGVFSEDEFRALPLGRQLVRVRRAIRFWENEYDSR